MPGGDGASASITASVNLVKKVMDRGWIHNNFRHHLNKLKRQVFTFSSQCFKVSSRQFQSVNVQHCTLRIAEVYHKKLIKIKRRYKNNIVENITDGEKIKTIPVHR